MKKILVLGLVLIMVLSLAACGDDGAAVTPDGVGGSDTTTNTTAEAEWKKFLKDYENWVDDYIALLAKYQADPTDTSILSDYTEMAAELTEWTGKTEEVADELANDPDALAEYTAELSRIAAKLSESQT